MGMESYSGLSGDMIVTKPVGMEKAVKPDAVDGSITVVRKPESTKQVTGSLGSRPASTKGLISPWQELKGWKLVPLALLAVAQTATFLWQYGPSLASFATSESLELHRNLAARASPLVAVAAFVVSVVAVWLWFRGPSVMYLVDYALFKPEEACKMSSERFLQLARRSGYFTEENLEFQRRILVNSGMGPQTYVPLSMHAEPVDKTLDTTLKEAEMALITPVAELLRKTGVNVQEIGVVVVNCVHCPVPSMTAMIVNRFGMREDVETFNLGGMGCSAGLIAISLARDMLKVRKDTYAIVVSTEMLNGNHAYPGNDRSMIITNCLFRLGTSAVLLSNKRSDRSRSRYSLMQLVRTHQGALPTFNCVRHVQDSEGIIGIALSKHLVSAAGAALKSNITTLAPKILPLSEKLKFVANFISRKLLRSNQKPYIPDFQTAVRHFCFHPGGRAILDGIQKNLGLTDDQLEPSRMTLHRFGNTSSSSIWYVLAYVEAKNRVRKNDLIWQIALGSGIKCNSTIWKSLRSNHLEEHFCENPWLDTIDSYPVPWISTIEQSKP